MQKPVKRLQSWGVSDELWAIVEPLIPERQRKPKQQYTRKAGGGRKPLAPRRVFEGIVFVLRTGIQWKALPKDYGASSSVHQYFQEWEVAGVFKTLWERGVKLDDGWGDQERATPMTVVAETSPIYMIGTDRERTPTLTRALSSATPAADGTGASQKSND